MAFLGVYRAIYDYAAQSDEELELKEGDLLFVLSKSTDEPDWWRCKKRAVSDDEEEPEGLVPYNYVEEAQPSHKAKALYDYSQQTDEEMTFKEEAQLDVYDESDPDWTLVGLNGVFGFAPAIYIQSSSAAAAAAPSAPTPAAASEPVASPTHQRRELAPPPMLNRQSAADEPIPGEADYPDPGEAPSPPPGASAGNPAAALAGIISQRTGGAAQASPTADRGLTSPRLPTRPQYTPEHSDEEEQAPPPMPQRPQSQALPSPPPTQYASPRYQEPPGVLPSPPYNRAVSNSYNGDDALASPGGFHLYNIHEMISHMGRNKKMPTTLGVNIGKGLIMISPEKSRDGPSQEWTADRLTHYSIEGKHVFVELVRPSKSVDFHAGAKDTAQEIVAQLGELAGAARAGGLREVLAASAGTGAAGQKKGQMLYEFMAQGEDEVTVAVGDEVLILDDVKSDEWWMVRRLKNGREGVVPSSYVEITGTIPRALDSISGLNAARSTVEQNRMEEERLAKEAAKRDKAARDASAIPERGSSLAGDDNRRSGERRSGEKKDQPKSKPNSARVRTWTDRSGTFKVEAEFIGLREGKIHLHKNNGVKIAVPVSKMSTEDIEYVERATGASLDDDKPLSDIKRRSTQKKKEADRAAASSANGARPTAGASVQPKDDYDWFDFFLQAGVNPQICERYAGAFSRDQMSPEVLPDVNEQLLRTLGLKEGDIIRVMKYVDTKYNRKRTPSSAAPASPSTAQDDSIQPANGGLFSGRDGTLRNNTGKGRPAPPVQTSDVVDEDAFKPKSESSKAREAPTDARATPLTSAPARQPTSGFEDDAWDVKPARTQASSSSQPASAETPKPAEPPRPRMNDDLELLALPLQPERTGQQAPATAAASAPAPEPAQPSPAQQPQQPPTADQALFDKIASIAQAQPRQRPQPPLQQQVVTGSALAPPPARAASVPLNPQQPGGQFGALALQPQLTGYSPQYQPQPQQQQGMMMPQATGFPQQQPQMQMNGFQSPQGYGGFQQPQQTGIPALQQNYPAMQPQPTGFMPQSHFGQQQQAQQTGFMPQQTGYQQPQPTGFPGQQPQYQQQLVAGAQTGSPFADPPRQPFQPTPSGLSNSFSAPQQTGFPQQQQQPQFNISQPTGLNGYQQTNGFQPQQQQQQQAPQLPPQQTGGVFGPSQPLMTPLMPQKTGPPPPVRFGVTGGANKLMPQPTGRANLSKATPQNPFGF